jgi:hypothetical protein
MTGRNYSPQWPNLPHSILLIIGVYGVLLGVRVPRLPEAGHFTILATLLIMTTAYFVTFIVSPLDQPPWDIKWLIRTTMQRLFMQVWPTFVLVYFPAVRTLDEVLLRNRPPFLAKSPALI